MLLAAMGCAAAALAGAAKPNLLVPAYFSPERDCTEAGLSGRWRQMVRPAPRLAVHACAATCHCPDVDTRLCVASVPRGLLF